MVRELNPEQKIAAETTEGPLLIFAGAGSGKTMVITHRIAGLLKRGVPPFNILAVTFTNKAAAEMRERVMKLAGAEASSVWISTFHSLSTRILRNDGEREFTIYDEKDQEVVIKECLKRLDLDPKKFHVGRIRELISGAKNNMVDPESFAINAAAQGGSIKQNIARVYELYEEILDANGGYDFDDLLLKTIKLLKKRPEILEKYRQRFEYIMVDEYQDTNYTQFVLIELLAPPQNNICAVGDDDQCLVEGTEIDTPNGRIRVEKLKAGDDIMAAAGWGDLISRSCDKISRRQYTGKIVTIRTKSGKILKASPNHILFAKLTASKNVYYVYLMFRKDLGYRIGITGGVRSKRVSNRTVPGIFVRMNQEKGDKAWILRACRTKNEASYYEQFFSSYYGIPTYTFHSKGRNMLIDDDAIKQLFTSIDTRRRARRLLKDMDMDIRYPVVTAAGYINSNTERKIINFTMFGENRSFKGRPWHAHRIQLNSSDPVLKKSLIKKGFNVRSGRKGTWRIETSRKNYTDAVEMIKQIANGEELNIVRRSRMTGNEYFYFLPASHVKAGMKVPVITGNGKIRSDIVVDTSIEEYSGYVYDISVPDLKNYSAQGVIVHNSIYMFRGADVRNILEFEKHFKDAVTLKLEQNYRSSQNILDAAHNVIMKNPSRKDKQLWTDQGPGEAVRWQEFMNSRDEARVVVDEILRLHFEEGFKLSDIAVFYRVNAQSRTFEDALRNQRVNYKVFGGVKFYNRKEIKDILAYMKVLVNPSDDVSMMRIINMPPRGIGKKSMETIRAAAMRNSSSVFELVNMEVPPLSPAICRKLMPLRALFSKLKITLESGDTAQLAREIIELSGYRAMLEEDDDMQARSRLENVEELVSAFSEDDNKGKDIQDILNEIALVSETDKVTDSEDYITLMTMHLAKGLEFPVVFISGMEEELFPHYDALYDNVQLEEERRLCYVAITRAKKILYMTAASQRLLYGQTRWHIPSRFVKEALGSQATGEEEYEYD
jgi:DNA helicase-2/ATP-dependent DNA helicase PcrA